MTVKSKRPLGEHVLGKVFVQAGARLGVWDPCYGDGDLYEVEPGEWIGTIHIRDEFNWGHRVKWLCLARNQATLDPREELRSVGVDSGQMGIYVIGDDRPDTEHADYDKICDLTLGEMAAGLLPYGVVSSSGFGDGQYEVYGRRNKDDLLTSIMVEFIPDENRDDIDDLNTCDECGAEIDHDQSLCDLCADEL